MHRLLLAASLALAPLAACGGGGTEPAPAKAEGRRIDVLVDGNGYTPAELDAKPGEALVLAFQRLDENNCGGELVFPATNEKVELPVGQTVEVPVTAPASGRLAFTCGMAMYEGAIVVSEG